MCFEGFILFYFTAYRSENYDEKSNQKQTKNQRQ